MSQPLDKISSQLLEAAMKAEFAESQLSLAQRISTRIASSPYSKPAVAAGGGVPVEAPASSPPTTRHPHEESLGPTAIKRIPMIISRNGDGPEQLEPPQRAPPTLSIDPLELVANFATTIALPQQAQYALEQRQNNLNSPHYTAIPLAVDANNQHLEPAGAAGTTPTQPQRGRRGTRNNSTATAAGNSNQTRRIPDLKTRAEATKEKNRRAQQRFRHKQKSRLEWLECEVTRLRNLLTEKGIDAGIAEIEEAVPIATTTTAAASPLPPEHLSVDQMYSELEHWLEECNEFIKQPTPVRYLQAWLAMSEDARRLHYTAVQKRYNAGKYSDVAVWVEMQTHGSNTGGVGAGNIDAGNGGSGV